MTNLQLYLCMFCSFSFSSGTLWAFLLYCSSSVPTQIYSLFNISSCINDSHWSTMYRWVVWPKTWFLNPLYFFSENRKFFSFICHVAYVNSKLPITLLPSFTNPAFIFNNKIKRCKSLETLLIYLHFARNIRNAMIYWKM